MQAAHNKAAAIDIKKHPGRHEAAGTFIREKEMPQVTPAWVMPSCDIYIKLEGAFIRLKSG